MYASLLTMCDAMLGRVLDLFDKHDLWKDTMLIVNVRANHLAAGPGCVDVDRLTRAS